MMPQWAGSTTLTLTLILTLALALTLTPTLTDDAAVGGQYDRAHAQPGGARQVR